MIIIIVSLRSRVLRYSRGQRKLATSRGSCRALFVPIPEFGLIRSRDCVLLALLSDCKIFKHKAKYGARLRISLFALLWYQVDALREKFRIVTAMPKLNALRDIARNRSRFYSSQVSGLLVLLCSTKRRELAELARVFPKYATHFAIFRAMKSPESSLHASLRILVFYRLVIRVECRIYARKFILLSRTSERRRRWL